MNKWAKKIILNANNVISESLMLELKFSSMDSCREKPFTYQNKSLIDASVIRFS